jgi:hypothetical protein
MCAPYLSFMTLSTLCVVLKSALDNEGLAFWEDHDQVKTLSKVPSRSCVRKKP